MAEPRTALGAVAITKTTYRLIRRSARPVLALMTVPFVASFLVMLISFPDLETGFVKSWFLSSVHYFANAVFATALLRYVLLNSSVPRQAMQVGQAAWHLLAVNVILLAAISFGTYLFMSAQDLVLFVMRKLHVNAEANGLQFGLIAIVFLVLLYLSNRFVTAGPLIVVRGSHFVGALTQSWVLTRRQGMVIVLASVFVLMPVAAVSAIVGYIDSGVLHGQSDVISVFIIAMDEYMMLTALTILSAVVFQGLSHTVESDRTS